VLNYHSFVTFECVVVSLLLPSTRPE